MTVRRYILATLRSTKLTVGEQPKRRNMAAVVALAYYMGAESATKMVCDAHNQLAQDALKRAGDSRYHIFARWILGPLVKAIYSPHYAGDMTDMFLSDRI
jgi:hypothetical protein